MPTYDFTCPRCNATLALQARIHDLVPEPTCPMPLCGVRMQRQWTAPGITFRGRGWGGKP